MQIKRAKSCCKQISQRQHANELRNNSSSIYNIFSWSNDNDAYTQQVYHRVKAPQSINPPNKGTYQGQTNPDSSRYQDYDRKPHSYENDNRQVDQNDNRQDNRKGALKRPQTAKQTIKKSVSFPKRNEEDDQIYQKKAKEADTENREKVKKYVDSLIPYTRTMTNSRFQQYYGKAALETYGRANTNEPIGGIIYGNHQKTFNINPHSYKNEPQYYQTHTTALNYGKRTKLNHEQKYIKLMRTLTKKLGLNDKNQTLKEGKEVVYVDVNDDNMYQAMKQNNQFVKAHRQEIRDVENQNKDKKEQEKQQEREQFFADKKARIQKNFNQTLNQSTSPSTFFQASDQERLNQQVIYRHHDQHGNVRLAADRHAITCYVDTNFPQNDAAYTEFLKSRMPIFPIPTTDADRNLDSIRAQNYQKSLKIVYPSHYLLPNCEQPEILKMISNRVGKNIRSPNKKNSPQQKTKNIRADKSIASTARGTMSEVGNYKGQKRQNKQQADQRSRTIQRQTRRDNDYQNNNKNNNNQTNNDNNDNNSNNERNKAQILRKAWESSLVANSILEKRNKPRTCCQSVHLPHNEKNPYCYKMASDQIVEVPFAGTRKH